MYEPPLGKTGKRRLGAFRDSIDGFYIAEQDLEMRGPGDMLGEINPGKCFKLADLTRDADLLTEAHEAASELLAEPSEHHQALLNRWLDFPPMKLQAQRADSARRSHLQIDPASGHNA